MIEFPPISDVLTSIEILKREKWPTFQAFKTSDEFLEYFQQKFIAHFNQRMIYLSVPLENLNYKFYRVRPLDEIKNPESIREYSYPPAEYCRQNRVNIPGHPVFYSSPNPAIALLETIRSEGTENLNRQYCISLWTLRPSRKFMISPFIYNIQADPYKKLADTILDEKLKEALKDTPLDNENQRKSFKAIMEYLSGAFVNDDENSYSISSFIGHSHLYMPHAAKTDLFLYPSIQSSLKAINIAINPKTVDEDLIMKYLLILKVTELDLELNHIRTETLHYGVCDNQSVHINPVGNASSGLDPEYLAIFPEFSITG